MINKPILFIAFLFLILVGSQANATKNSQSSRLHQWLVQPKACIVQKLGDKCQLVLNITIPPLEKGEYCFYLTDQKLNCFNSIQPQVQLTVVLVEDALLELRKQAPQHSDGLYTLYSQKLEIKTRETTQKVRRVRDPWSLF